MVSFGETSNISLLLANLVLWWRTSDESLDRTALLEGRVCAFNYLQAYRNNPSLSSG